MTYKNLNAFNSIQSDWLIKALRNKHIDHVLIDNKLKTLGITGQDNNFLPIASYLDFFDWGATQTGNPFLGLDIAQDIDLQDLGILAYLLRYAPTLGDLFALLEQYQIILMQGMQYSFKPSADDFIECQFSYTKPDLQNIEQDIEFSIAILIRLLKEKIGTDWSPERINFSYSSNKPTAHLKKILGNNCYFDQPCNSVILPSSLLTLKLTNADPLLLQIILKQANIELEKINQQNDFIYSVKLLISIGLSTQNFSVGDLANQLNLTTRTLNRRLHKYNTCFNDLRNEIILDIAKEALLTTESSITEIAMKLGYSDSTTFVRSFKRLAQLSPLQYRKKQRQSL